MKTKNLISAGKIAAIALIILGIIHDVATYTPIIRGGLVCLNPGNLKAMTYMSLVCGTSFIFCGILFYLLLNKLREQIPVENILLTNGIFLALCGVLSVIFMLFNPFAWIALVLNLILFSISLLFKLKIKK